MLQFEQSEQALARADFAAAAAGLRYVSDEEMAGLSRRRNGSGFAYYDAKGGLIRNRATLKRIRALAIPPAWTSIWISPISNSHIAATGRDAKGRKQYRYSPDFVRVRDAAKFDHLVAFAQSLPSIRKAVARDMRRLALTREKIVATIVALLEETLIRVGNEGYARQNGSFGLTTLRNRHVRVTGSQLRFEFHGKSGRVWSLAIRDRRVAKIIRACQELPGQNLFQYRDADGTVQSVTSGDVNDYLRGLSGRDITAKDFRTWAGTVEAAAAFDALARNGEPPLKKNVKEVIAQVAERLGNTPTVCRRCYVHPAIVSAFENGTLALKVRSRRAAGATGLDDVERAALAFLKADARRKARANAS